MSENPFTLEAASPADLGPLVERFGRPRIVLLGDWMLDEYIYGSAERLSPEAPVPVVSEKRRHRQAGGAGNVAVFLAALGADVDAVGMRGDDEAGNALLGLLTDAGIATDGIRAVAARPTSSKTRIVGLAQHRHPQQMLRLDREDSAPIDRTMADVLLAGLEARIQRCDLLCLEDYNKGALTDYVCQSAIALCRKWGKEVLVDPALIDNYDRYANATAITPNRTEAELATGLALQDHWHAAPELAAALRARLNIAACILTLDRHGIYLLEDGRPGRLHATRPRNVYDVTGAGDMVLAVLALARAAGGTWGEAVDLGNIAGGLEVEKFGCVPITREEILRELWSQRVGQTGKRHTEQTLVAELGHRRQLGQRVVFTNGIFDILHAGHAQYLQFARSQGDALVVGINSDASTKRLKGADRPVNILADRMAVLEALAAVDYIVPFEDDTPEALVRALTPDVLVKGSDYADKPIAGAQFVAGRGGRVVLAPLLDGRSTSNVISKARRAPSA